MRVSAVRDDNFKKDLLSASLASGVSVGIAEETLE